MNWELGMMAVWPRDGERPGGGPQVCWPLGRWFREEGTEQAELWSRAARVPTLFPAWSAPPPHAPPSPQACSSCIGLQNPPWRASAQPFLVQVGKRRPRAKQPLSSLSLEAPHYLLGPLPPIHTGCSFSPPTSPAASEMQMVSCPPDLLWFLGAVGKSPPVPWKWVPPHRPHCPRPRLPTGPAPWAPCSEAPEPAPPHLQGRPPSCLGRLLLCLVLGSGVKPSELLP